MKVAQYFTDLLYFRKLRLPIPAPPLTSYMKLSKLVNLAEA